MSYSQEGNRRSGVALATAGGRRVTWACAEQVREGGAKLGAESTVEDEVGGAVDHHEQVEHVARDPHHLPAGAYNQQQYQPRKSCFSWVYSYMN